MDSKRHGFQTGEAQINRRNCSRAVRNFFNHDWTPMDTNVSPLFVLIGVHSWLIQLVPSKPRFCSQATERSVQVEQGKLLFRTPNPWPPFA